MLSYGAVTIANTSGAAHIHCQYTRSYREQYIYPRQLGRQGTVLHPLATNPATVTGLYPGQFVGVAVLLRPGVDV